MMDGFNHFDELADKIKPALQQGIQKTAKQVQENAAGNAPVDTGFLKSSIYVAGPLGSTYGGFGTPPGDAEALPEEKSGDDLTAIIGVAASYAVYQEMGTRFHPPHPYLTPG